MTLLRRLSSIAICLTFCVACGGAPEPAPAPETSPLSRSPGSPADTGVTGRLAPDLAPPSTLIALIPEGGVEVPIRTEAAIMDQAGSEFLPAFLLAQAGQTVMFRNSEDVLHNVRVTEVAEQRPVFNIATAPFGSYQHTFERPGFYNVGCDIHSTMRADILVLATPYTAMTGADGGFTIAGVQPGSYSLTIYTGSAPVVRQIDVKSGRTDLGVVQ